MATVVFMGTPDFAVPILQVLLETQNVVGVVTQPDKPAGRGNRLQPPPVKLVAEAANVPVYQPPSLRKEEALGPLREWAPDAIIVAAFGQILRPHVLYLPRRGSINVHASLLPRWRGASPIQHAILAGDAKSGVSLMQMDEGLDTGPVFVQETLTLDPRETTATLHDRLSALGAQTVRRHLDDILAGRLAAAPQPDEGMTYAALIRKEAGRLDWTQPSDALDRLVRAMSPWPGAYAMWAGEPLKVLRAHPSSAPLPEGRPGLIVATDDGPAALAASGGLVLDELQLPGKRAMAAADFVRGRPDLIGSVLG